MPTEPLENDATPSDNPLRIEGGGVPTDKPVKQEITKFGYTVLSAIGLAAVFGSWQLTLKTEQNSTDIAQNATRSAQERSEIRLEMAEIRAEMKERAKEERARDKELLGEIRSTNNLMDNYVKEQKYRR